MACCQFRENSKTWNVENHNQKHPNIELLDFVIGRFESLKLLKSWKVEVSCWEICENEKENVMFRGL